MLGAVWTGAGILRWFFGTRITLLLFPPVGLEDVDVAKSLVIGVVLIAVGGVLGRQGRIAERESAGARSADDL